MVQRRSLAVLCDGLRLRGGAYLPDATKGVLVLLHGIPSVQPPEPGDEGYPGLARRFAEHGWAAAWADMRAARESPGHFSIEGWVRDVHAIVDASRALDGASGLPLGIVGSSAGGAVAVEATRRGAPVDALVLLGVPAAWISFADDAREGVRRITEESGMALSEEVLADPAEWVAEFDAVVTESSVASLRLPLLIVHGTADDVVPVEHAYRIAERAPGADLRILEGAPHQLRRHPGVFELVLEWLDLRLA
jgi:pimeloyl-ACP methyl ester carboxylesterase